MVGAEIAAAIIVVAAIWVVIASALAILAAKRLRRAQSVLDAARTMRSLLDAAPARAMLVHADDKVELDGQLIRELGLSSPPKKLGDLAGKASGFDKADVEALKSDLGDIRLGGAPIHRQLRLTGRDRVVLCRVDSEDGLTAGEVLGITLYQGRLIDGMSAARPKSA